MRAFQMVSTLERTALYDEVNQFYTAPTAVRALMKAGDDYVTKYDKSSLRILGSVGEPINPEAWRWYYSVVGESRCPIVDTYWQTETGMDRPIRTPRSKPPSLACFLAARSIFLGRVLTRANTCCA